MTSDETTEQQESRLVPVQCIACGAHQRRSAGTAWACVSCGNTNPPAERPKEAE